MFFRPPGRTEPSCPLEGFAIQVRRGGFVAKSRLRPFGTSPSERFTDLRLTLRQR